MKRNRFPTLPAAAMAWFFLALGAAAFLPMPETLRPWLAGGLALAGLALALASLVLGLRSGRHLPDAPEGRQGAEQDRFKRSMGAMMDSVPDPVYFKDPEFRFRWVNRACLDAYSTTEDRIIGRTSAEVMAPDNAARSLESDKLTLERGSAVYEIPFKDRWYEVRKRRVDDEDGRVEGIAGVLRDVTDRKRAQADLEAQRRELERLFNERTGSLAESEARMRGLTDAAMDPIILVDGAGLVRLWNRAAEAVFGYSAAEILGRDVHETLAPEGFLEESRKGVARFARTGLGPLVGRVVEVTARRKDGSLFEAELSLAPVEFGGKRHAVGILRDATERLTARDELARYADDLQILKDLQEENAARMASTVVQLELAKAELEAKNSQLEEAMALREDMERMARHDLKSPIQGITGAADMLKSYGNLNEDQLLLVRIIEESGQDMLDMVEMSLILYKMERGEYEPRRTPVDLGQEAERVALECGGAHNCRGVAVDVSVRGNPSGDGPAEIMAERLLVRSMLGNVIKNALEATPDKGRVAVDIAMTGGRAVIRVSNPGAVPKAIRADFFDKYATHGKKDGSGLGTYSARLAAKAHGGDIAMSTSEEDGTTVVITLPLTR